MRQWISRFILNEFLLLIVFVLLLQYCYINIQSTVFGYIGYGYSIMTNRTIISWVIIVATYLIVRYKESNLYSLFIYIIFYISIIPFIIFYQYSSNVPLWMVLLQVSFLIFTRLLLRDTGAKSIQIKYRYTYDSKTLRNSIYIFILLYFVYIFSKSGIPSLESLLFENVYDTRAEANLSVLMVIIQNLLCRIVIPLIILIAIEEKDKKVLIFVTIVQVYTYAVTGFKTYLFIPLLMIGLRFMSSINLKKMISIGLPMVLLFVIGVYKVTENIMTCALFSDRVFFFPAIIKYAFFDYFSTHEFVYFSQNSFCKIFGIQSNYPTFVPNIIGGEYFDKPEMMANTGYMADAYSNLGVLGVFIMTIVLVVVIRASKKRTDQIPIKLRGAVESIFIIFFYTLNDGHVINVLFSGGMLFIVLIASLVDFRDKKNRTANSHCIKEESEKKQSPMVGIQDTI